jgi:hypothetical protein
MPQHFQTGVATMIAFGAVALFFAFILSIGLELILGKGYRK